MDARRIAIVEDNEADVFLVEIALEQAGLKYEMRVLPDGKTALEYLREIDTTDTTAPDLLLLDLNLPQYSGEEILERVRRSAKCSSVSVIVMTSSESPKEKEKVRALGATFFAKPSNMKQFRNLADLIRATLDGKESGVQEPSAL